MMASAPAINNDYILCADDQSLADAVRTLSSSYYVALDCEGRDLGEKGGALSLISLRTLAPGPKQTYIIDVVSLGSDKLRPVFDIIRSSSPTKIVFDGRMDFSELYHGYNVNIEGALDLQLADVQSRGQRGEGEEAQLRRLSPFVRSGEVNGQRSSYRAVHKLCSLDNCIKEHNVDIVGGPSKKQSITHKLWMNRPLPEQYLQYASRDVYLIELLYTYFKDKGYINDQLPTQSARYISMWRGAKPQRSDTYKSHPLLPLGILDYYAYSPTRSCEGCQRDLPSGAYSKMAWSSKPGKKRECWVCRAISVRNNAHKNWNSYDDDYYCYDSDDYSF